MRSPVPLPADVMDRVDEILKNPPSLNLYRRAVGLALRERCGMKAARIADVLGLSLSGIWRAHARVAREGLAALEHKPTGGRLRSNMSLDEEREFLSPFLESAADGRILEVSPIHRELEAWLGREVPASTVYRLLARHGWRKIAPRPRHPEARVELQDDWKKNSPNSSPRTPGGRRQKGARRS